MWLTLHYIYFIDTSLEKNVYRKIYIRNIVSTYNIIFLISEILTQEIIY